MLRKFCLEAQFFQGGQLLLQLLAVVQSVDVGALFLKVAVDAAA